MADELIHDLHDHEHEHEDDFSMAFIDTADRLSMLLIHGFPLNSAMWSMQIDDLNSFARIIAPDLRGHGNSDAVPGPYSMTQLADDCADIMGHLAVATPFVVGGLSMGGYVVFEFYRRYPEHVAGLILTATRAAADPDEAKANRDAAAANVAENGINDLVEGMLPKLLSPKNLDDVEMVSFVRDILMKTSVAGAMGALMAMKDRPDSTPTLAEIDVPTLIIHGADDQIVPLAEAEAMHKAIKGSKLVVLKNAGHLPNLEQPDAFNDAVIDFLEGIEAGLTEE
ncbi:MAG: alpha/beta fold hydrolase [Chloroflexi bacterium]|nr:MAG: alpha/beta fold hydrolase [Chloroflexota bacterium]